MRFKDMQVDMLAVIIDFGGEDSERPEHWSQEMDDWQGHTVTIASIDSDYVYIEEDEGAWSWTPSDFDPYCNLKFDNPNIQYRRHKQDQRMEEMRKEWNLKQEKARIMKVNPYASS